MWGWIRARKAASKSKSGRKSRPGYYEVYHCRTCGSVMCVVRDHETLYIGSCCGKSTLSGAKLGTKWFWNNGAVAIIWNEERDKEKQSWKSRFLSRVRGKR